MTKNEQYHLDSPTMSANWENATRIDQSQLLAR